MRKFKISVLLKLGFYCLFLSIGLEMQARKFVHPGILHTTKSIERMRAQIADKEYPAYGSFELLKSHELTLLLMNQDLYPLSYQIPIIENQNITLSINEVV